MEAAPLFEDLARAPKGGEAWWLTTSDGARIRTGVWPAAAGLPVKGTVLAFPGRTEYVEKYGPAAAHFTAQGFAFLSIDWRGQGLAERELADRRLGHVRRFADYQADLAAVLNLAEWLELPKPYFLVAHSMGGCIGLRALHEGLDVAAAALSAPMWGIQLPPRDRPLAWISALVGPLLGLGGKLTPRSSLDHELTAGNFPTNTLTHDAEMWDFMKTQIETETDLALGGPTLQWLRGALLETTRLARMTPPAIPTLTLLGTEEAIVHPDPIRAMMEKWPGGTLEMVPGARHELMMELPEIRNHFYARATELFLRHAEA